MIKSGLFIIAITILAIGLGGWRYLPIPVRENVQQNSRFGDIALAQPWWGASGQVLVFGDDNPKAAQDLARQLADLGVSAAVAGTSQALAALSDTSQSCIETSTIATELDSLWTAIWPDTTPQPRLLAGLSNGAVLAYLHSLSATARQTGNLSINFSVESAQPLHLCTPLTATVAPLPQQAWRTVWTDQPPDVTARFSRSLGHIDSLITAYDTPLPAVLLAEVQRYLGKTTSDGPGMPVVEVPAAKPSDTVTIFYSGDGGWRDLDRTVAAAMAAQNFPVVGVDVLRYFWAAKTPAQTAADLAELMQYYRQHWQVQHFVLAGYSFGADILPAIYNQLPATDQASVSLLALIALGQQADFEIHVSGWLGKTSGEQTIAPQLAQIPKQKLLCIYGVDEKQETACTGLSNSPASILELPGGHHFDEDYPKLTGLILDVYRQHGVMAGG